MRLRHVAVVAAALLLSGCASGPGALEVGGSGVSMCIPEGAGGDFAVVLPLQNTSGNDVTITSVTLNMRGNLQEIGPVVLDDARPASDDTMSGLTGGGTTDIDNWDTQRPALGAVVPANSRISLGIPLARSTGPDVGTFSGVTVTYEGGSASSSASAVLETTC